MRRRPAGMAARSAQVEERGFSAIDFLKNKHRKRLDKRSELGMHARLQHLFTLHNFLFVNAFVVWTACSLY